MIGVPVFFLSVVGVLGLANGLASSPPSKEVQPEEEVDHYRRWLDEEVGFLVTEEEREVFSALTTDAERERFIEAFWRRRDPDPTTEINEFKEEHYRRLAYANDHFTAAVPGWKSDRGRIYIIHGPPDAIEKHLSAGLYNRPPHEGGGSTQAYPFEVWFYRELEGVGTDVELEFVDVSLTGEYRLVSDPDAKDALLLVPEAGPTLAEQFGAAEKADRPHFSPGNRDSYPLMPQRAKDSPFQRYETYEMVQRPPELRHPELRELVTASVEYATLPLEVETAYFQPAQGSFQVLVFLMLGRGSFTPEAEFVVYGRVTDLGRRVVLEFDDGWRLDSLGGPPVWSRSLMLSQPGPYKLELVVKDTTGGRWGIKSVRLTPPSSWTSGGLSGSSVLLCDLSEPVLQGDRAEPAWKLPDRVVRPRFSRRFLSGERMGVYLQLYGHGWDQASGNAAVTLTWRLRQDEAVFFQRLDAAGKALRLADPERLVIADWIPLRNLSPGEYELELLVQDEIKGGSLAFREAFTVAAQSP